MKYKVTLEIEIIVEADTEEEAAIKADEEWANGNFVLTPYIEEVKWK